MDIETYTQLAKSCYNDYVAWLKTITIPYCGFEPKRFIDIAEQWQIEEAEIIGRAVRNVWCNDSIIKNVCITRPRGHDKTSSIARVVLWSLLFPRPNPQTPVPLDIRVAAVDSEQAKILIDIISTLVQLNNLSNIIKINSYDVHGPGGRAIVVAADASSAFGLTAHIIILDELTHWETKRAQKLFSALWSGRSKVKNSCTIILTNSGYKGTWQYNLVQSLKQDPSWYVYDHPGRLASWHDEKDIENIKRGLSPQEVQRLIYNYWVENDTKSIYQYVMENIVETQPSPPAYVIVGVDYASKRDLTAISVLEVSNIVWVRDIIAGRFTPEELHNIIRNLYWDNAKVAPTHIVADIYQMEYMSSILQKDGVQIHTIKPTNQTNKRLISLLLRCCESKILCFQSPYLGEFSGSSLESEARYCTLSINPPKIEQNGHFDDRIHSIGYALLYAYDNHMLDSNINIELKEAMSSTQTPTSPILDRQLPNRIGTTPKHNVYGIQPLPIDNTEINDKIKLSLQRVRWAE